MVGGFTLAVILIGWRNRVTDHIIDQLTRDHFVTSKIQKTSTRPDCTTMPTCRRVDCDFLRRRRRRSSTPIFPGGRRRSADDIGIDRNGRPTTRFERTIVEGAPSDSDSRHPRRPADILQQATTASPTAPSPAVRLVGDLDGDALTAGRSGHSPRLSSLTKGPESPSSSPVNRSRSAGHHRSDPTVRRSEVCQSSTTP